MNAVRDKASLSRKTVQKVARNEVVKPKHPRRPRRVFATKVKISRWEDGLDPRIVAYVKKMKIFPSRIEVRSPDEIIIHNNSFWNGKNK